MKLGLGPFFMAITLAGCASSTAKAPPTTAQTHVTSASTATLSPELVADCARLRAALAALPRDDDDNDDAPLTRPDLAKTLSQPFADARAQRLADELRATAKDFEPMFDEVTRAQAMLAESSNVLHDKTDEEAFGEKLTAACTGKPSAECLKVRRAVLALYEGKDTKAAVANYRDVATKLRKMKPFKTPHLGAGVDIMAKRLDATAQALENSASANAKIDSFETPMAAATTQLGALDDKRKALCGE